VGGGFSLCATVRIAAVDFPFVVPDLDCCLSGFLTKRLRPSAGNSESYFEFNRLLDLA
jgi:hypothetical protein